MMDRTHHKSTRSFLWHPSSWLLICMLGLQLLQSRRFSLSYFVKLWSEGEGERGPNEVDRRSLVPAQASFEDETYESLVTALPSSSSSMEPVPSSPPKRRIEVVVGQCTEDIAYLDAFERCRHGDTALHFHVLSPCMIGATPPSFVNVTDCVTIHRSTDCGRETYSYFAYVADRYDDLPDLVAFVQGSAVTENPHIVEDVLTALPGTRYMGLSRLVRSAWHMRPDDEVKRDLHNRTVPQLLRQSRWTTSWRSQFMASREALRSVPRDVYLELMDHMCHHACVHVQCALETWLGPLMGCAAFLLQPERPDDACTTRTVDPPVRWTVVEADYTKDGNRGGQRGSLQRLEQRTCVYSDRNETERSNYTLIQGESWVNGIFVCLDDTPQEDIDAWLWSKTDKKDDQRYSLE